MIISILAKRININPPTLPEPASFASTMKE